MDTILDIDKASVFFDGTFAEPVRLAHPEGVAVAQDGSIWCGTETGHIMRIEPDGTDVKSFGCTNGFIAGIAFDGDGGLFACDIRDGHIYRLDIETRELSKFGTSSLAIPNYPVVDLARKCLYVSDSVSFEEPGVGIWSFDLETSEGSPWCEDLLFFANGMALGPDGQSLFVVESKKRQVTKIAINADGSSGELSVYASDLGAFPDGLSFDAEGNLYVSCYEPSEIYKVTPTGEVRMLIKDVESTLISHPTNSAFRGNEFFTTNLGRWHITRTELDVEGLMLPLKY